MNDTRHHLIRGMFLVGTEKVHFYVVPSPLHYNVRAYADKSMA